ncbi:SdpA family antimicrobial peptide system protein [Micromonospora sp. NPDC050417]|uniref:SdpA family antimicrobial peptide system protein n=1 Tax=Micromonospora sp. NPDC050417 TaxID=3364280 RepID=UPI00378A87B5
MDTSSAVWRHRTPAESAGTVEGTDRPEASGEVDGTALAGCDGQPEPETSAGDRADLRLGRSIASLIALAVVAVVYVLHAALPATPFELPFGNPQAFRTVVPEGWGFFTMSPRTPDVLVYGARADGGWRQLTVGAHEGPASLMGLNRRNRSQGTEVAIVANQLRPEEWSACEREPLDCLSALRPREVRVTNFSTLHSVCGEVGLVMQDVLPWAWRGLPTEMPSKVVRVVVSC